MNLLTPAELKRNIDLRAYISQHEPTIQKGGKVWCVCPFHQDKNPSMIISGQSFHCFGCGATGDVFDYHMRKYNTSFPQAVEALGGANKYDASLKLTEINKYERMIFTEFEGTRYIESLQLLCNDEETWKFLIQIVSLLENSPNERIPDFKGAKLTLNGVMFNTEETVDGPQYQSIDATNFGAYILSELIGWHSMKPLYKELKGLTDALKDGEDPDLRSMRNDLKHRVCVMAGRLATEAPNMYLSLGVHKICIILVVCSLVGWDNISQIKFDEITFIGYPEDKLRICEQAYNLTGCEFK